MPWKCCLHIAVAVCCCCDSLESCASTPLFRAVAQSRARAPKDHINIRILQTMISGFPLKLGLGTRMSDPCVYVVFWAPKVSALQAAVFARRRMKPALRRLQGRLQQDPALPRTWLFVQVEGPLCACPSIKSPTIWGLYSGAWVFGNSYVSYSQ